MSFTAARRTFTKSVCALAAAPFVITRNAEARGYEKSLSFYNLHTGEALNNAVFWENGSYIPETLSDINNILRDHRTGDVHEMDPKLALILHGIKSRTGVNNRFNIISGYRSPKTNTMLRGKSSGVAKKSFHMLGQAMDMNLEGADLTHVRSAALDVPVTGGVGIYGSSGFVHVDTGPRRTW